MSLRAHTKIARLIDPRAVKRVRSMSSDTLAAFLPSVVQSLAISVDQYLYHDGATEGVDTALDAFNAVWSEMELRKSMVAPTISVPDSL